MPQPCNMLCLTITFMTKCFAKLSCDLCRVCEAGMLVHARRVQQQLYCCTLYALPQSQMHP